MADIKINLLPWRDERRELQKQEFIKILAVFAVVGIFILVVFYQYFDMSISTQNKRNKFLTKEIAGLDEKIERIGVLKKEQRELLARMKVIQDLQGNRPIIVRVFDELVRQLAPKVFFTRMKLAGHKLDVIGVADTHTRISTQIRNFDASEWFKNANVSDITSGNKGSVFVLTVEQTTPKEAKK